MLRLLPKLCQSQLVACGQHIEVACDTCPACSWIYQLMKAGYMKRLSAIFYDKLASPSTLLSEFGLSSRYKISPGVGCHAAT